MRENFEVSVIIPTYNRANLLPRAIESVLNQTYQDFEVIVVDDASCDNTEEVVQGFNDPRIKYVKHKINKGGSAARNTGIKTAEGKYIAFLDSDDEWLPEKLEKQVRKIERSPEKVGVIYTRYWIIQNGKKFLSREPKKRGDIFEDELIKDWVSPTSCVLVKRECFAEVGGFDENLPVRQDYDMWLRIAKYFYFDYIKEPLAKIYFSKDLSRISLSGIEKEIYAANKLLEKYEKDIRAQSWRIQRKIYSSHYYVLGHRCWKNKNAVLGRKYFAKAIKMYPFDIKYFMLFAGSLFGSNFYNNLSIFTKRLRTIINLKNFPKLKKIEQN